MDETRVHIRNRLTKECGGEWERGRGGEGEKGRRGEGEKGRGGKREKNATDKAGA